MNTLTLGSLFSGIGGFEISATWAGIEPIWSNEIDPWCCKVLRKNFNHEIIEKDIRKLNGKIIRDTISSMDSEIGKVFGKGQGYKQSTNTERICTNVGRRSGETFVLKSVDILTGGFPCQPFSHAGKRKGKDDNRYLWPEYLRLIRELQPTWIIAENVAGLISMENGRTLEGILIDLENENYTPEIYNIPACGVGAWHKRERIWILAHTCNSSNRTNRRKAREKESIQSKHRKEGCSRMSSRASEDATNTTKQRLQNWRGAPMGRSEKESKFKRSSCNQRIWEFEPNVGRVADGVSGRVDRLKGLGNAIVTQVAYEIIKAIVEYEK
ncbi:MAG: DNA (cytosine-5-)-methyltransferase [Bacteroidetes bacterium]|nr:DNA (cytosine-5-)-methyltransferase [Bacteroidota bacterium]